MFRKKDQKTFVQKIREQEAGRQQKIKLNELVAVEKKHNRIITKLREDHYKELDRKNNELRKAQDGWYRAKSMLTELTLIIQKLTRFGQMFSMNAITLHQQINHIDGQIESAGRYVLKHDAKINKLLGVAK